MYIMSKTIPNIMKTVTPSPTLKSISKTASSPTAPISQQVKSKTPYLNDNGIYIMKIILVVGVVAFLIYNIYLYYSEGTDILGKYFGYGVEKTAELTEKGVDTVSNATEKVVDVAAGGTKKVIETTQQGSDKITNVVKHGGETIKEVSQSPLEIAIEKQQRKQKRMIDGDIATESSIQNPKKPGYCYIGTDRTFRTCVKMDEDDVCLSGKIFPSRDICINPNLRR